MKKVLVIRFSSIGDLVLTTPVIRCVHRQMPAEVHVLTKPGFSVVFEASPYVHRIHRWEGDTPGLLRALRNESFDLVIDLHKNLRSQRVRLALGVPAVAFDKLNLEKWLRVHWGWDRLPRRHLVDRYFDQLHPLGVHYDGEGLDYAIPPAHQVDTSAYLGSGHPPFLAVVLGAAHATKQIPGPVLQDILQRVEAPALLLGGPAEAEAGKALEQASGPYPRIALAGALSLHQSASVLQQAAVVLTPDTGLMHIAAALRKPVISLWGNTIPAFGMYPFLADGAPSDRQWEVAGLSCRPCSKLGAPQCPKGHFRCMRDQPAGAIAESIRTALAQAASFS